MEFALGLISIMSVVVMILAGLHAAHAKAQACQLAREGARHAALAREGQGEIRAGMPALESESAGSLVISMDGQWIRAHAQWALRPPASWLASHMSCDVHARVETERL